MLEPKWLRIVVVVVVVVVVGVVGGGGGVVGPAPEHASTGEWVFIKGGCSRRGVQWMGAVLHNRTAYNRM